MRPVYWVRRVWRDRRRRTALIFAVLTAVICILLLGSPQFSNASQPRWGSPILALQFVRSVGDVDLILGEEPSLDRETMRIKTYIDFGLIVCYVALLVTLAVLVMRDRGVWLAAGIVAAICALSAGIFDVIENRAILRLLDQPLRFTSQGMLNAIRGAAIAKWSLLGVTVAVLISNKVLHKS